MTSVRVASAYQRSELDFAPLTFAGLGIAIDSAISRLSSVAAAHGRLMAQFCASDAAEADRRVREEAAEDERTQAERILYSLSDRIFAERITDREDPRYRPH